MEWKTVKLGEVLTIKYGKDYKGLPSGNVPVYGSGGIMNYVNKSLYSQPSVLIPRLGTLNNICYVDKPFWTVNTMFWTICDTNEAYPKFIYYSICKKDFSSLNLGSAVPRLTVPVIESISILLPPLETQRRITAILSSLDDKIENNNRINRNLEAQAQALFKSWFVDFEPWGGIMPDDWRFNDISNIPHVLETGRRPKGGAVESGVPSIGAEHIKGMGTYDFSKTKYITEDYARSMKSGKINGYELLIYKDGGKPGYFIPNFTIYGEGYPFEECYLNEHVLKLDFPSKAYNIFSYFYFQTPEVMNYLNAQGGKAAIPGINKSDIDNINILTPDNEAVVQFGKIVLPYFTKILRNLAENKRLAALRDTLLPKLMKGEIEV